jgi:hypothetical protein
VTRPILITACLLLSLVAPRRAVACEAHVTVAALDARAAAAIAEGRGRELIAELKAACASEQAEPAHCHLLARAYHALGNQAWCLRTLRDALRRFDDCASRAWLAWALIDAGRLPVAREALAGGSCPDSDEERVRSAALLARAALLDDDEPSARAALDATRGVTAAWPRERDALQTLRARAMPGASPPVTLRAELGAGVTSNALAGSPVDPDETGPASGITGLDLAFGLELPPWRPLRASIRGRARGEALTAEGARELSAMELGLSPGLVLGRAATTLRIGYAVDTLWLKQDEDPLFYHGHRLEAELGLGGLSMLAGGGYRSFRDDPRTRFELDLGAGAGFHLGSRVALILGLMGRAHWANEGLRDMLGLTAVAATRFDLGRGWRARLQLSGGVDAYVRSGGEPGRVAFGVREQRVDALGSSRLELWTPAWAGARLGLRYGYALRDSTADAWGRDHDYQEHRTDLLLRWRFSADPWRPQTANARGHVPLPGQGGAGAHDDDEQVRDLLRRDEAERRGRCGCDG